MPNEFFGYKDSINISAIANVQQHVRDASGRWFFKGREDAPDAIHLLFHLFLFYFNGVTLVFRSILTRYWVLQILGAGRREPNIPELMDHVAFWMPVLVLTVPIDLDELLEDRCLASVASLGKPSRVMVMTVYFPLVLVVAVLSSKNRGTYGAREMFDMVFPFQCSDIWSP